MDTVKRGDMTRAVRGLGVLATNRTAEISIPETQAQPIRPGQQAQIDTRNGVVRGKVVRVAPGVANGLVKVEVQAEGALPSGAVPGLNVDGTIEVEVVKDVIYVGRPATGSAQSDGVLFKLDEDRQHATRVNVKYGRASTHTIEVVSGLQPGEQVILSDMTAFATKDRVRLQ
jgi:HlyD family secretion protein